MFQIICIMMIDFENEIDMPGAVSMSDALWLI